MMCAPLCINNRPVAVVPVAPSRRRRPSRKSAALGADDEAMEWKGRSPGSSGAEAEVISFVHVGAVGHELAVGLNRNMLCDCAPPFFRLQEHRQCRGAILGQDNLIFAYSSIKHHIPKPGIERFEDVECNDYRCVKLAHAVR